MAPSLRHLLFASTTSLLVAITMLVPIKVNLVDLNLQKDSAYADDRNDRDNVPHTSPTTITKASPNSRVGKITSYAGIALTINTAKNNFDSATQVATAAIAKAQIQSVEAAEAEEKALAAQTFAEVEAAEAVNAQASADTQAEEVAEAQTNASDQTNEAIARQEAANDAKALADTNPDDLGLATAAAKIQNLTNAEAAEAREAQEAVEKEAAEAVASQSYADTRATNAANAATTAANAHAQAATKLAEAKVAEQVAQAAVSAAETAEADFQSIAKTEAELLINSVNKEDKSEVKNAVKASFYIESAPDK
ncbi:MAG: hypothetical protein V7776_16205 [Halopseudomonas aestusnigri]